MAEIKVSFGHGAGGVTKLLKTPAKYQIFSLF